MGEDLVGFGETYPGEFQQFGLRAVSLAGRRQSSRLTHSSLSSTSRSATSLLCISDAASSHLKSRTMNLIEDDRHDKHTAPSFRDTCLTHLFSRHLCTYSSRTFLNKVTVCNTKSSSAATCL